jgi:putative two-component system response regulator
VMRPATHMSRWAFFVSLLGAFLNTPDYGDIAKLVSILIHMREPYNGHGARVADFAVRMATAAGLSSSDVKLIGIGAQLHDIGKLLIRPDLLNATRKLNDSERAEMQNHTRLGHNIVFQAGYEKMICDIVLFHQEKWNGSGYPLGLMGDQIPMPAQIVSVCDVYEALTNTRPYRLAYSVEEARALMLTLKNIDFGSHLVEMFFEKVVTHE